MLIETLAVLALQSAPAAGAWTWTLYEDPLVLANEVPDTAALRTTLECDAGSSVTVLTLYGLRGRSGMARLGSGELSTVAQASAGRDDEVKLTLRTDHPVFSSFAASGRLSVAVGEAVREVTVTPAHLGSLRRFSELCSG